MGRGKLSALQHLFNENAAQLMCASLGVGDVRKVIRRRSCRLAVALSMPSHALK